jgi:uncharacterized protein (TIGR02246 family)
MNPLGKWAALTVCAAILCAAIPAHPQNPEKDERAIRRVAEYWQQDWNHHKPKALADLLTEDADYVNFQGFLLRGRKQIEDWFTGLPAANPAARHRTNQEVSLRFLQTDIVVVHITWSVSAGAASGSAAKRTRLGISTWVMVKQGSQWRIRDAQDTLSP